MKLNPVFILAAFVATAVRAQANDWIPAAGLWTVTVNSEFAVGMPTPQLCADGKTIPNQFGANAQGQPLVGGLTCKSELVKKDSSKLVQRAVCEMAKEGGTIETVTNITSTGKDQYRILSLAVVTFKGQEPTEVEMSSDMKRISTTCPADMKPGDIKMSSGKIYRDGKLVQ
jgi:hypothetical protein